MRARFVEYRRTADRRLRNELVEEHRWLAEVAARRFKNRGEPLEDLTQVALLGLVKAVERFDPEFGTAFSTFAMPTLLGELRRHFRDTTWAVHVPRAAKELHLKVAPVVARLAQELGRSPQPAEVAAALDITVDAVLEAAETGNAYRSGSLDDRSSDEPSEAASLLGCRDRDLDLTDVAGHAGPAPRRPAGPAATGPRAPLRRAAHAAGDRRRGRGEPGARVPSAPVEPGPAARSVGARRWGRGGPRGPLRSRAGGSAAGDALARRPRR